MNEKVAATLLSTQMDAEGVPTVTSLDLSLHLIGVGDSGFHAQYPSHHEAVLTGIFIYVARVFSLVKQLRRMRARQDRGVVALTRVLRRCTRLTSLHLSGNGIRDEATLTLCASLRGRVSDYAVSAVSAVSAFFTHNAMSQSGGVNELMRGGGCTARSGSPSCACSTSARIRSERLAGQLWWRWLR